MTNSGNEKRKIVEIEGTVPMRLQRSIKRDRLIHSTGIIISSRPLDDIGSLTSISRWTSGKFDLLNMNANYPYSEAVKCHEKY